MARTDLQAAGGAFTSLDALNANLDDLYAYYGVAAGNPFCTVRFVDGDYGNDTNDGLTAAKAKKTIQGAINASGKGDRIFIKPLEAESASGDTDPDSYAETLTITGKDGLQLIGVGRGLAQGGQPQIKIGAGTTAMVTVNSFGVGIHNLTFNGAGSTGGGIKLVSNGSTIDAGGAIISNCHFKNCKSSAAAASGGAIYWSSYGGSWYLTVQNCEFFDCRAGITRPAVVDVIPKAVKITGCKFWAAANTTVDADIYTGTTGILGLMIDSCFFGCPNVPAYASSPDAARYVFLTGSTGLMSRCFFACLTDSTGSEKTFGASGTGGVVPTTMYMAGCWGEGLVATTHLALIGRT